VAALVAILVALLGHAILVPVLRRITRFSVLLSTLLDRIIRPGQAVLVLVALQLVWGAAPDDLPFLATVTRFTALMLTGALTWLAMRAVGGIAEAVVRLHPANVSDNLEARRVQTQTHVLARTVMFFVLIVGCGVGLMTFQVVRQIGASRAGLGGCRRIGRRYCCPAGAR